MSDSIIKLMPQKPIRQKEQGRTGAHRPEESQRLIDLRSCLAQNRKAQESLRTMRDDIRARLHSLEEFISTYILRTECPPASRMLSYIKFERNTPASLKEQSRGLELQEAIKNTNEEDFEFMKKLNEEKPARRRRELHLADLPRDPSEINFIQLAAATTRYKSGLELYKAWLDLHRVRAPKRPYTNLQEGVIIEKQRLYRDNWEKICQYVEGRSFEQVYYEFHNRINPKMRTGRWTLRETLMLLVLLEHYGVKRWALIAQKMAVKSELQVRERFCNIMDPTVGKNLWTPQMEERLLQVAPEHAFSWKEIAKLPCFGNKTDNSIWRKYRNLMIKRSREEIQQQMRNCTKKALIDKILAYKEHTENKRHRAETRQQEKREAYSRRYSELVESRQLRLQPPPEQTDRQQIKEQEQEQQSIEVEMREQAEDRMIYMMY